MSLEAREKRVKKLGEELQKARGVMKMVRMVLDREVEVVLVGGVEVLWKGGVEVTL